MYTLYIINAPLRDVNDGFNHLPLVFFFFFQILFLFARDVMVSDECSAASE